jgi:hypothetical protein
MSEYYTDILLWSERQAELLRRRAAELVIDAGTDWRNIACGASMLYTWEPFSPLNTCSLWNVRYSGLFNALN